MTSKTDFDLNSRQRPAFRSSRFASGFNGCTIVLAFACGRIYMNTASGLVFALSVARSCVCNLGRPSFGWRRQASALGTRYAVLPINTPFTKRQRTANSETFSVYQNSITKRIRRLFTPSCCTCRCNSSFGGLRFCGLTNIDALTLILINIHSAFRLRNAFDFTRFRSCCRWRWIAYTVRTRVADIIPELAVW